MLQFWEVADRAINSGPLMKMKDFDLKIFKVSSRLVKEYGIKYDPKFPIPSDNDMGDRLFEAGLKLYVEVGTYCIDTERVIKFSEEELQESLLDLSRMPEGIDIGDGAEKRHLFKRGIGDPQSLLSLAESSKVTRKKVGILFRCTKALLRRESWMESITALLLRVLKARGGFWVLPSIVTLRGVRLDG